MEVTKLYRPVGQRELEFIAETGYKRFPPRFPEQPPFYSVTNQKYASQIARDWNTKDAASGFTGHALRFAGDSQFLSNYPREDCGKQDLPRVIPTADLDAFNQHIQGQIEKVMSFP